MAVCALLVQLLGPVAPVRAADPVTVDFAFTGTEQSFTVPDGVTSLAVVLVGGRGGAEAASITSGGFGARVEATLAVEPGTLLYLEVGGNGGNGGSYPGGLGGTGGFNGGGNGGIGLDLGGTTARGAGGGAGASDIRTLPRTDGASLDSRLVVAAGGGGGGTGGTGGAAGAAGTNVIVNGTVVSTGGAAGTSTAGGAGGSGDTPGSDGGLGTGASTDPARGPGGGGGGGLYGGGSGGGATLISFGAGGGGGSSFTGLATNTSVAVDTSGAPRVSITYAAGAGSGGADAGTGTVDAVVTMASSALCLELSTTSIDFGSRQFGDADVRATPDVNVTNCGDVSAMLLGRGTDATGTEAAWALVDDATTCADDLGTDRYHLALREGVQSSVAIWRLGTTNKELLDVPGGFFAPFWPVIDTACPGSSGAGQQLEMQIVFTVIEPQ